MSFCSKDNLTAAEGVTVVDNQFLLNFMPDAPETMTKVYLLGYAMCDDADNSAENLARKLGLTVAEVMDAFLYWEELSLVQIVRTQPTQVVFLSQRGKDFAKKINPRKYDAFNREMQSAIPSRLISVNEWNEYYTFLDSTSFQPEALVAVAKYCADLKGSDINYPYVLTVARNLYAKGISTLERVGESLTSQSKFDDDIKYVFKALKTARKIDHADRVLYEKWTSELGFTLDVICAVAKQAQPQTTKKLDGLLTEFYRNGAMSSAEIKAYSDDKQSRVDLAKEIDRSLGVYYQTLDPVVTEYVSPWLTKGFDDAALILIAKYCFKSGIRTLAGMNSAVEKFFKNGLLSVDEINAYLARTAEIDAEIRSLLERAGAARNVTAVDRQLYKNWRNWGLSKDLLDYAADLAVGTVNPAPYMSKILSDWKNRGISDVTAAKAAASSPTAAKGAKDTKYDYPQRAYSKEEIDAMFSDLDNTEF